MWQFHLSRSFSVASHTHGLADTDEQPVAKYLPSTSDSCLHNRALKLDPWNCEVTFLPTNLYNVWFEDVCEDAITIKQTSGQSNIIGGGAKNADDKVVQHNGGGTVKIDSYCVQTFGKLYRSCGNCSTQYKRTVLISQIIGKSGSVLAGINSNYGDIAQFDTSSLSLTSVSSICDTYQVNSSGAEPTKLTSNVSNAYCKF
ncbi:unnamed protein product [Rhizoctonia solani]|uniref:Pectate lyase n=1 Tax=Rhizoctonia solani TaxID=456999 RepID=A0A8H3DXK7_9AGAM|nr:unnamed protein product [Rhizoctonia solani]